MTNTAMEARYGRGRKAARDRRNFAIIGGLLSVALIGFIFWAAFGAKPEATGTLNNFKVVSSTLATMDVVIDNPTGHAITCIISAVNHDSSSVGSKQVGFSSASRGIVGLQIATVEKPMGGSVDACK